MNRWGAIILGKKLGLLNKEEEKQKEKKQRCISAVVDSAAYLQERKTGALMVIERETKLGDIINTGTVRGCNSLTAAYLQYLF